MYNIDNLQFDIDSFYTPKYLTRYKKKIRQREKNKIDSYLVFDDLAFQEFTFYEYKGEQYQNFILRKHIQYNNYKYNSPDIFLQNKYILFYSLMRNCQFTVSINLLKNGGMRFKSLRKTTKTQKEYVKQKTAKIIQAQAIKKNLRLNLRKEILSEILELL